ncbi:TPM domain-containing protein [Amnibacterium sp. CER49]|uniref:TPM domain-containing protein n=1 Tax=Amnibacterium sp. CER49 TaxID=3039161 RepID=UPI002448EB09|nr:TPM domain-containing protein [Amnibacterium sp. CER49]MDH2444221.1 TPM domain-containing protein [Amnibacterium sp. CER49]
MRLRRITAGLAIGALLALGGATAADATAPLDTNGSAVVDQANALSSSDESRIQSALTTLHDDTGATMSVVFVPTFTGASSSEDWAIRTAKASGVGQGDLLLAVAVQDRQYGYARSKSFPLDRTEVQSLSRSDLVPDLSAKRYADAVVSFANALDKAAGSTAGSSQSSDGSSTADSPRTTAFTGVITVLLLIALVVVGLVLWRVLRRRRAVAAGAGPAPVGGPVTPPVDQKELDQRASRALIALDDELTTSEQELGFAEAEFGGDTVGAFRSALESARGRAKEAFAIRQQLDDDKPETPDQRRTMTERILALCEQADKVLADQKQSFDDLRRLEAQLPSGVSAAEAERTRLTAQADQAGAALAALTKQYGDEAVRGSADDLTQARSLLGFAQEAIGRAANAGDKPGEGAVALRGAQQALGQASTLLTGIVAAPGAFQAAKQRLDATLADTRSDADEARRLLARAGADRPALEQAITNAEAAVATAATRAPTAALPPLEKANAELDEVAGRVRDRADRLKRAQQSLPRTLDSAQQSVEATRRFIDTRRGGVGAEARTRISEAQRQLDLAIAAEQDDPPAALTAAQRAQVLANEAYELAQQDVDDFRSGPWGGGGGYGRGGYGGGGFGGALGGAVLGGVLGGILTGGDRGWGGGWGGGPYDGGWGGGGWGGDVGGGGGFDGGGGGFDGGGGGFGGGDSGGGGGGF